MANSKTIKIRSSQSGQRIDKFLAGFCAEKSRAQWQKIIKSGNILINKKIAEADYILKENDGIEILETIPKNSSNSSDKNGNMKVSGIKIIYEDEDAIIIDKPAGVLAQKAASSESPAVSDFLIRHFPEIEKVGEGEQRFGIVHRLDKDTSGVMIAAKNNQSFEFLKDQFKNRLTKKIYLALVYGKVKPKEGSINLKIGRSKKNPQMQTVIDSKKKEDIKSREAITFYKTIKEYENYTLLEVCPKTGRMHQIRVHLKALGFPVVGDKKYFFRKHRNLKPQLQRQFLHAQSLAITLPNGIKNEFRSELPGELKGFLDQIESSNL